MAITFRHDAAAVVPPSNSATRKYGQELVLQQRQQNQQQLMQAQQMKYQGYQAGLNRLFDATQQANQNQFQLQRDNAQFENQKQMAEAQRQQQFMNDARKQSNRFIMDSIENGEYDDVTARELRQNIIEESEAMGNPALDATQRAEALNKLRARRAMLSANRMPKEPKLSPDEEMNQGIATRNGVEYQKNPKTGVWEPLQQPKSDSKAESEKSRPTSADEALRADPKALDPFLEDAKQIELGEDGTLDEASYNRAVARAKKMYEQYHNLGTPMDAPEDPRGAQAPAQPGQSRSILEGAGQQSPQMAQLPDAGQPPAPSGMDQYRAQMEGAGYRLVTPTDGSKPYYLKDSSAPGTTPQMAQLPDDGQPPAPGVQPEPLPLTANSSSQNPAGAMRMRATQQSVTVGGKPLTVSPGTLTPQETAARAEIMKLPREQRIASLMPYDPELKGKTLDQILEDPATKAGYDELTKQGLTTGNYREDMLTQLDEMLQHNVLKGAGQTPPDAYVGMNVNDITDPKAKAEIAKLPRPKTQQDMLAITGPYFIDRNGIIRGTKK